MSVVEPIEITDLIAEVVEPCNNCRHSEICKYAFSCTQQVQDINTQIAKVNSLLSYTHFTISFNGEAIAPILSCEYYDAEEQS